MAVQPQTGIATPEGNGNTKKMVSGTVGRIRRGRSLSDGLTNGADCKDCVLSKTTQSLSHKGNEINPRRAAGSLAGQTPHPWGGRVWSNASYAEWYSLCTELAPGQRSNPNH